MSEYGEGMLEKIKFLALGLPTSERLRIRLQAPPERRPAALLLRGILDYRFLPVSDNGAATWYALCSRSDRMFRLTLRPF